MTAPGVENDNLALAVGFALAFAPFLRFLPCLIFALVIFVPVGGPKVAVTVWSASIFT